MLVRGHRSGCSPRISFKNYLMLVDLELFSVDHHIIVECDSTSPLLTLAASLHIFVMLFKSFDVCKSCNFA